MSISDSIDSIDLPMLRQRLKQQRAQLSPLQCQRAAIQLAKHVATCHYVTTAHQIGVYLSQNNEIDLAPSIQWLWQQGKQLYLPVLHPCLTHILWFAPYTPESRLQPNRYGILEPRVHSDQMVAPWELDVVLAPLLAFDDHGNRLGMGGGYYDRSFAFLKFTQLPHLLGCAYHFQRVKQLPSQPWDIPLHAVLTDCAT